MAARGSRPFVREGTSSKESENKSSAGSDNWQNRALWASTVAAVLAGCGVHASLVICAHGEADDRAVRCNVDPRALAFVSFLLLAGYVLTAAAVITLQGLETSRRDCPEFCTCYSCFQDCSPCRRRRCFRTGDARCVCFIGCFDRRDCGCCADLCCSCCRRPRAYWNDYDQRTGLLGLVLALMGGVAAAAFYGLSNFPSHEQPITLTWKLCTAASCVVGVSAGLVLGAFVDGARFLYVLCCGRRGTPRPEPEPGDEERNPSLRREDCSKTSCCICRSLSSAARVQKLAALSVAYVVSLGAMVIAPATWPGIIAAVVPVLAGAIYALATGTLQS